MPTHYRSIQENRTTSSSPSPAISPVLTPPSTAVTSTLDPEDDGESLCPEALATNVLSLHCIGGYRLGKKLGEGAFAVVRRGVHIASGMEVACKICVKPAIKDEYVRKNLYREADILRRLRHPNIIQLLEVVESETFYVLVMELCGKDVLSHLCSVGVSGEAQAKLYARQLIKAFEYMHSKNIVHRDLKAENIMMDKGGRLTIIDFGLSNDITGKSALETQCGSMAYSAPELLSNKSYGKEVDIWSIGVCLYVILTGHLPFGNLTLTDLHAMMLDGNYELPDVMSEDLKDLFMKFFQVKPHKRITIEELWQHQWISTVSDSDENSSLTDGGEVSLGGRDCLNDRVIIQMVRMGFSNSNDRIATAVLENKCDSTTATYHLLIKRHQNLAVRIAKRRRSLELDNVQPDSGQLKPLRPRDGSWKGQSRLRRTSLGSDPRGNLKRSTSRGSIEGKSRQNASTMGAADDPEPPPARMRTRRGSLSGLDSRMSRQLSKNSSDTVKYGSRTSLTSLDSDGGDRASLEAYVSGQLIRSNSTNTSKFARSGSRVGSMVTYPGNGLDLETYSHSETISAMVLILMEMMQGTVQDSNSDELQALTFRALRVAPDMALIMLLNEHGWSGSSANPFSNEMVPGLLLALQAFESTLDEVENSGLFRRRAGSTGSNSSSKSDMLSDTSGEESMSMSATLPLPGRRGSFSSLPSIGRSRSSGGDGWKSPRGQRRISNTLSPRASNTGFLSQSPPSPSPPPILDDNLSRPSLRQRNSRIHKKSHTSEGLSRTLISDRPNMRSTSVEDSCLQMRSGKTSYSKNRRIVTPGSFQC